MEKKQKALFIAEKSSEAEEVRKAYLKHKNEIPYEIDFVSQAGHLLTLKMPEEMDVSKELKKGEYLQLPILPGELNGWNYKPISKRSKEIIDKIKTAIKSGKYDLIIHGGDPDREGQLLVDIVLKSLRAEKYIPSIKRFWLNGLNESRIIEELKNMKDGKDVFFKNLYKAGLLRQRTDWLFGINGSRATSSITYKREAVGRVKTALTRMIVDREHEIKNFTPKTSYQIRGDYDLNFSGVLFNPKELNSDAENLDVAGIVFFDNKKDAEHQISNLEKTNKKAKIILYQTKQIKSFAPSLYKMSSLQVDASNMFGIRPDRTLEIVQDLYLKGLVSYPRTNCSLISSQTNFSPIIKAIAGIPELTSFCSKVKKSDFDRVRSMKIYVNDKEMEKHGHTGLCPTEEPLKQGLSSESMAIYNLIAKRFLSIFLDPLIQNKTDLIAEINDSENKKCLFKTSGKTLVSKGFTELLGYNPIDKEIPFFKEGDELLFKDFQLETRVSAPPKRFTGASLIAAMENPSKYFENKDFGKENRAMSLGTEATRSSIINTLIEKDKYLKYMAADKKGSIEYIVPTENGENLVSLLRDTDICKVDTSAEWENILELVKNGEMSFEDGEKTSISAVKKLVEEIKSVPSEKRSVFKSSYSGIPSQKREAICTCPSCGKSVYEAEKNFYCEGYKDGCKISMYKNFVGSKISASDFKKLIIKKEIIEKKLKNKDGTKIWTQKLEYDFNKNEISFVKK